MLKEVGNIAGIYLIATCISIVSFITLGIFVALRSVLQDRKGIKQGEGENSLKSNTVAITLAVIVLIGALVAVYFVTKGSLNLWINYQY